MKTLKTLIAVVGGVIALITIGWQSLTISDAEIKTYIEDSLVKGCRPVIDLCAGDCGQLDLKLFVQDVCIPNKILRADYNRVLNIYIQMGERVGEKNIIKIPDAIRKRLETEGKILEPVKESLWQTYNQ